MTMFTVIVIREGRKKDYRDFWNNGVLKNASGEELHPDLLSFSETIEAKNKEEALSSVEKKYPRLLIDEAATQRHG